MKIRNVLILAAVGTAAALLLNTRKGKELRNSVADNAGEWKNKLSDFAKKNGSLKKWQKKAENEMA